MVETTNNPFANLKQELDVDGKKYNYYNLKGLDCKHLDSIPYSIRVLLESAVRNCDSFHIHSKYKVIFKCEIITTNISITFLTLQII